MREVLSTVHADAALFFSVVEIDGRAQMTDLQAVGVGDVAGVIERLQAHPERVSLEGLQYPDAIEGRSFLEGVSIPKGFRNVLAGAGVADRIRLLVYDGPRFVGWIGALRLQTSHEPPFSRADRRKLVPVVSRATRVLLEADRITRASLPSRTGFAVVTERGDVEYASAEGAAWLGRTGFRTALQRRLWAGAFATAFAIDLAEVRVTPMEGRAQPLFLLQLMKARPVETSNVRLSPAQREVASYAASGATVAEIATALGRAPETVRTHLREAYARLGVSNRVELARALAA